MSSADTNIHHHRHLHSHTQLLQGLSDALLTSSDKEALAHYARQLLMMVDNTALLAIYEPDASQQMLSASLALAPSIANPPDFPDYTIHDLSSLVSHCYVMRSGPEMLSLHSHVSDSAAFRSFQDQFTHNPMLYLQALSTGRNQPALGVLVLLLSQKTGDKTVDTAAMNDLLVMDSSPAIRLLTALLARAQQERRVQAQRQHLEREINLSDVDGYRRAQIDDVDKHYIGKSPACRKLKAAIIRAASNRQSVLIEGETGTGKDHVATLIHHYSARADQPFIAINCAALPAELIEMELFGAKKGAYTGSVAHKKGLIEAAHGGVLFLDEIGDMPIKLQAVLLRVLNEKRFRRVGDTRERSVDFRLISATNAPLAEMVEDGRFRRDLFYRLCQVRIKTPQLRDHREDIPALCQYFAQRYHKHIGSDLPSLSELDIDTLKQYRWPGNVRELDNFLCNYFDDYLYHNNHDRSQNTLSMATQLHDWCDNHVAKTSDAPALINELLNSEDLRTASAYFERELITQRLLRYQGNRRLAARSLGLPKRTLAYKCQKLNISAVG